MERGHCSLLPLKARDGSSLFLTVLTLWNMGFFFWDLRQGGFSGASRPSPLCGHFGKIEENPFCLLISWRALRGGRRLGLFYRWTSSLSRACRQTLCLHPIATARSRDLGDSILWRKELDQPRSGLQWIPGAETFSFCSKEHHLHLHGAINIRRQKNCVCWCCRAGSSWV